MHEDTAPDPADIPEPPAGMVGAPGPLLRLVRNQKVAFLLVGGTNTVIGFAWFVLFDLTVGQVWGYFATLAFSHVFSVLCAFILYRTFVFRVRGHVWRDLARFEAVYLVAITINFILLPLLVEGFSLTPIAAQGLIVFVTTMISYFGHRGFSFRRSANELASEEGIAVHVPTSEEASTMRPLVSIVIPAYNNADYLESTLTSVLAQTYENLEVIIADHASTDGTRAIALRFTSDARVTLLDTEAGGGAERNWNRVSRAATGEYIKLVCGDDLLQPEIVERQLAALESSRGAVLAASPRDIIDASDTPVIRERGLKGLLGRHSGTNAVRATVRQGTNVFGEPGCVLMRRDILERIGWWDGRFPYLIDEATYAGVLLHGDFVGIGPSLAAFRVSDSQWSVRLTKQQAEQAIAFHDWIHEHRPDVVSNTDRVLGNVRARINARMRRVAYLYLGRRMKAAPRPTPSTNGGAPA